MDKKKNTEPTLNATLSASGVFDPLAQHFKVLDDFLDAQVDQFSKVTRSLVRYTLEHRGKRLRPALVFFCGGDFNRVDPDLVRAAAIVEMIHLSTLVHDDILDDAQLRHGSPTLFAKYGSHTSVLLGDAILSQATILMTQYDSIEFCRATAKAVREICDGEVWQTAERGNADLSLDDYFKIIQMKTGELFEISAFLGASIGGQGVERAQACAKYARLLGRAYQIFDDLVDFLGTEKEIGKTLGTDLASGKYTLPLILWLDKKMASERAEIFARIAAKAMTIEEVVATMRAEGVFERSRAYFNDSVAEAVAAIDSGDSDDLATQSLKRLAAFVKAQVDRFFETHV
ncbi:MAG: polyprenyl synthetase family protein [Opitutales bacterium]|nr:polyprenyl synthetase family protein [Opitutales bacterium]